MKQEIVYDDLVVLRKRLGVNVLQLCGILGVSKSRYYSWKYRGISNPAHNLLLIMWEAPVVSMEILRPTPK